MDSSSQYLYPSGRIAVLTTELMGKAGLERLDRTKDLSEFLSILSATYLRDLVPDLRDERGGEEAFADERSCLRNFIEELAPDPRVPEMIFLRDRYLKLKLDAKRKAGLMGTAEKGLEAAEKGLEDEKINRALEIYSELKDPIVIDLVLDKEWLEELSNLAKGENSLERIATLVRDLYSVRVKAFSKYLGKESLLEKLEFGGLCRFDELLSLELGEIDDRISSILFEELEKGKYEPYGVGVVALYVCRRIDELSSVRAIWLEKLLGVKG